MKKQQLEKKLGNITFWARELRLPLFWLTDKNHKIISGSLFFYKNSVLHAYHLNNREIRAAETGYKFFTDKKNLQEYEKQVVEVRNLIKSVRKRYENLKMGRLPDTKIEKEFFAILEILNYYSNVYTKTEEIFLSKLEKEKYKYRKAISKLGKQRFILRREGEPIFYILLGVLFKEIGKRFGVKVADLLFYDYAEMRNLFEGRKVWKSIITKRKKGYALISFKNKRTLLTGEKFKKLFKEVVSGEKKTKEITGRIAMKGRAMGRVRIILHNRRNISKAVKKFKKGEVLVTEMTRPDTVLACRKAAAIITDEGGITSHAAIVSRELGIPAVIGTKIATQVLQDGDLVEVDANKGIVKILKRK